MSPNVVKIEVHWNENANEIVNANDDVIGKCLNKLYANTDTNSHYINRFGKTPIRKI